MKIIHYEVNTVLNNNLKPLVAAIGFFDGIHKGHQQLIKETIKQGKMKKLETALITFSPSPISVLKNTNEELLTTLKEREKLAKKFKVDNFIVLKFNKKLSYLSPDDFYSKVIKKLNIKHLVCGEDFRYGKKGAGSVETLEKIDELSLSVISDFKFNDQRISSTRIKKMLKEKKVQKANEMLGYSYQLSGYVMHGRKKGRTIGFPTLNLQVEKSKFIPKDGVYIGITEIKGREYASTINIGHNPTINTVNHKSIESYVHDYDQNTYGQKVTFKLLEYIREEIKFKNVEQLISQMNKDIEKTKKYILDNKEKCFNNETI